MVDFVQGHVWHIKNHFSHRRDGKLIKIHAPVLYTVLPWISVFGLVLFGVWKGLDRDGSNAKMMDLMWVSPKMRASTPLRFSAEIQHFRQILMIPFFRDVDGSMIMNHLGVWSMVRVQHEPLRYPKISWYGQCSYKEGFEGLHVFGRTLTNKNGVRQKPGPAW